MLKKILSFIFIFAISCSLQPITVYAIDLHSPRFKLDLEQLEVSTDRESEPVAYTIKTVYGSQKYNEFNSNGFTISYQATDKPVEISLSDSLILISNTQKNQEHTIQLTSGDYENQDLVISLAQEQPLENFYGDSLDLEFTIGGSRIFRLLPKQISNKPRAVILNNKDTNNSLDLVLRLKTPSQSIEGTYQTTLNFISGPGF